MKNSASWSSIAFSVAICTAVIALSGICATFSASTAYANNTVEQSYTMAAPPAGATKTVTARFNTVISNYRNQVSFSNVSSTNANVAVFKYIDGNLVIVPRNPGTATLKATARSLQTGYAHTHIANVKVQPFTKPFASFRVGSADLTALLNRSGGDMMRLKAGALSGNLKVKMANGWKLTGISYADSSRTDFKELHVGDWAYLPASSELTLQLQRNDGQFRLIFVTIDKKQLSAPTLKKWKLVVDRSPAGSTYKIKWDKVPKADGYQVRFYLLADKWVPMSTTYQTKRSYAWTGSGVQNIGVQVRAYRWVNGKRQYGNWSILRGA